MTTQQNEMSEAARKAKNAYQGIWRKKNPEKIRQYHDNYWERQAQKQQEASQHHCLYCGSVFEPKRADAKFCSDRCRVSFNRAKS